MRNSTSEYVFDVLIQGRTPATEVHHGGQTYIEGRPGSNYTLRFRNNTSGRVKIVPSVDGLCVLDGKPAGLESPGYVVDGGKTVEIPGWKVDGSTAAKFVFAEQGKPVDAVKKGGQTYAEAIGADTAHLGLIGLMVFREKPKPILRPVVYPVQTIYHVHTDPWWNKTVWNNDAGQSPLVGGLTKSFSANSSMSGTTRQYGPQVVASSSILGAASAEVAPPEPNLGTGFGEATEFRTHKTEFQAENPGSPNVTFVMNYNSLMNLKLMGVPVEQFRPKKSQTVPNRNPFPASPHVTGTGCPVPPGWSKRNRKG